MQIEHALDRYLTQLRADGRSEHTAGQYRRHITLLASWICDHGKSDAVEDIDHEMLAQFLSSPRARTRPDGKSKKATSTNALRTSLRTFFRYVHDAGYTRSNPSRLIRRALCGTPAPRGLSDEGQGRLLAVLASAQGPKARRDQALFALMLATGIRIGSALALEVGDVDLERGELRIGTAKGDVPTTVFMGRGIARILRPYIEGRDGPLFPGQGGTPLSSRQVQRRLRLWCERAGVHQPVSPHDLRHAFAIQIYRKTRDLLLVQQALRHRSIASTTVYAKASEEDLRRVLA